MSISVAIRSDRNFGTGMNEFRVYLGKIKKGERIVEHMEKSMGI